MPVSVVEEKIRQLPEVYLSLVNNYVDSLLAKASVEKHSHALLTVY